MKFRKLALFSLLLIGFVNHSFCQSLSVIWPKHNEVISDRTPLLSWNGIEGIQSYQISLSQDSTFASGVQSFSSSNTQFQLTNNLISGTWFWKASGVLNGQSFISNLGKFQVFQPTDIPSLCLWLRADTNIVLDANGKIQQWKDLSNNNYLFAQNTISKRPNIISSSYNSLHSINFNGAQVLSGGDILDIGTGSRSMFVFGNYTNTTTNGIFLAKALAGAANNRYSLYANNLNIGSLFIDVNDFSLVGPAAPNFSQFQLLQNNIDRISNSNKLFRNKMLLSTAIGLTPNYDMNSTFRYLIGGYNDGSDIGEVAYLNGNISEIIFINSVNTNEIEKVNNYLMDRYAPPVNLGADISPVYPNNGTCVNQTITASIIYSNYLWSNGETTSSIQVTQPGVYWVQTTDIFGRTSRDTIVVNNPKMNIFNFEDTLTCLDGSILINPILPADNSFNSWSNGVVSQTQSFNAQNYNQFFFVEFSNISGCIIQSNSFKILVDSSLFGISLGQDTSLCSGNPIQLQNPPLNIAQYSWNTGNNQPTQIVDTAGQYILEVTNLNGCQNSDTIIVGISGEGPLVTIAIPSILCEDNILLSSVSASISSPNSITSISWDLDDGIFAYGDTALISYQTAGIKDIEISVMASNGCLVNLNQSLQINPNPIVQIQTVGSCLYDTISFSTQNNGFNIQNYSWNLGQNTNSNSATPSHVYNTEGTYLINVHVSDINSCQSISQNSITLLEQLEPFNNSLSVIWPKHNEVISDRTPVLSWNGIEGVQSYQISLSQDSTFALGVLSFTSSNTQFQFTNNLSSGMWFWKVNGNFNNQNYVSNLGKFLVFEPTDIPNLCLWLRADTNVVLDANGKIQQWKDLSSQSNHFNQSSISKRPSLNSNIYNSLPAIQFSGAQVLSGGDILDIGTGSRSMFVFGNYTNTTANGVFLSKALAAAANNRYSLYGNNLNIGSFFVDINDFSTLGPVVSNFSQFQLLQNNIDRISNSNKLFRNKMLLSTAIGLTPNYDMNSSFRYLIGAYNDGSDIEEIGYLNGNISEIVFINSVNSNEIEKVNKYLMDRYSPPVNLGADINPTYLNNGFCVNETIAASNIYTNYLWSNNATTSSIQVTQPGMYWVQTTDIFGRISRDTILVNKPTMNIFDDVELKCFNSETSLIADIPSNHTFIKWNNCNPNLSNQIQVGNQYFVEFTNNQGCIIKSNLFSVGIDSSLANISLGADTNLCSGNTIQLQNTPANITQYTWNTGNTQASQIVDTSGLYMLEVTNSNNCQNQVSIMVDVIGTSPTLNYSFPASICQFSEGQFQDNSEVPNGNGTINNKTWSISEGSSYSGSSGTFAIDTAGTFNVTLLVETLEGCSSSTTFPLTVHPKPILSFTTQNYCPYEAVAFTPTNSALAILSSQFWNFDDNTTSNSPNPSHIFGSSGVYNTTLEAQDINGCRDTVTQAVYIQPAPIAAFSFNNTCEETEVNFVNNSSITDTFNITMNKWSYGDGTQVINPSFQKIYTDADTFDVQLIVTANNGCQDTTMQSIIIYPRPTLGWQVGPACKNTWTTFENLSSVSVGSIAQTDWLVNLQYPLEGTSSAYQFVTTGVQYLNLTSTTDNGCQRDTLIIVNVQPEINAAYTVLPQTIVAGVPTTFTSTSTGATQYTWNLGNGNIIQTTVAEPVEATGFDSSLIGDSIQTSLIIENTIGCKDTATQYIKVYEPRIDLAITQLFVQDLNSFYKVGVELRNQGFVEITKTDLLLKMYGSMPILETENESLAPGESRIYLFNASPSAYISTQDNETSYLCVEATSYNDYQLIETELSNNISCLNTEGENFVLLPIYPNPTNDDISYTFILSEEATLNTSLTDETGRIVMNQSELHSAGLHTQILSMRNLSAGVYYFHISDGHSAKTVKILKN